MNQRRHDNTRNFIARLTAALALVVLASLLAPTIAAKPQEKLYNRPYADLKRWHLGFSVGMHVQDLNFTHNGLVRPNGEQWYSEVPDFSPGFCVNVLADLRLHKYFNLRVSPGIYFGNKVAYFRDQNSELTDKQDIKTCYVTLPIDLKISGDRLGNTRPYLTAGIMGTYDVSKKKSDFLQFNSADVYLTVGLGCDFYLPFFKLNPEIKFCFGMTDILRHNRPDLIDDPETMKITEALSKVKSNMVVLTFYFE
ncbi:MAG: PorT family protein [Prevotella sp.]|nr:PorT family protein [Bacteroides sp.]MCM1366450.1 PorT family protein [Prevotella sp.]MCM1437070.1 PorT family protein [Prevotella sp.]